MRLIDADKLKEELENWSVDLTNPLHLVKEDAFMLIENAPTIDAVQVVRCKDCTAWQNGVNWPSDLPEYVGVCIIAGWTCGENGYCLYGKRRDDETD